MKFLITGGAGFIGSALIRQIINQTEHCVINVDKLTYAGNLESLAEVSKSRRYSFEKVDICDFAALELVFKRHEPDIVIHLAAESHVDRSIEGPMAFVQTNVVGTCSLLMAAKEYWCSLEDDKKTVFRFHHVSTDEVYGDLHDLHDFFTESTPYAPSSPYSASKASSDHFVRSWSRTYGLPVLITNCSNNYGPYHFPEKLIPHMILNALDWKRLPVYGDGLQIRDWLYVEDHARALYKVALEGSVGETYNIGGLNECTNLQVVNAICNILDELKPSSRGSYRELITFVEDRPGHDRRYAIDASKITHQLNWKPLESFESGLRKTIEWYLVNESWWKRVLNGSYKLERLGAKQ